MTEQTILLAAAVPPDAIAVTLNKRAARLDTAFECYERGYRLSPRAPDVFWNLTGMGWVDLERGNHAAAPTGAWRIVF